MMLDGVVRVAVGGGRGVLIRVILGVIRAFFTTGLFWFICVIIFEIDIWLQIQNTTDSIQNKVDNSR